ncbi:alpha-hydroxy acid oxidase [Thauera sinica]|uniref:Alpha-hydroxy acid oxidase n=1 Tax=Thauera sinica TaxID=2665146 RepID=A0ABW1AX25_9RHOO|nr:alpha-hydroxy acid oxidase [Thauera sp. K11]ATE61076.1 alpha-hydroxy-acid oxidizing enzyme [Thauera sp. K11]
MNERPSVIPALHHIPPGIQCAQDYEALADRFIPAPAHAYIAGGSGQEATLRANLAAFDGIGIAPRLLRDVTAGHTRVKLLGRELRHPVLLAPVAFQTLAHPGGEIETARAADATDSCLVASTLSSFPLEDIARATRGDKWFQLYFQPRRESTLDLVRRAEAAGFGALVVTVDASVQSPSLRARRAGFRMPDDVRPANLQHHVQPGQVTLSGGQSLIFQGLMSEAPTWDDLAWIMGQTALPVLVKGVLHADDAHALQAMGVAGLVVSNHGGRTLDGIPASLKALPRIREAVGAGYPLLLDSGIRGGSDIFKALALGADAVMIGRLQVYALAVAGALGVAHLVKLLREELELCMALAGCPTPADITPAFIER